MGELKTFLASSFGPFRRSCFSCLGGWRTERSMPASSLFCFLSRPGLLLHPCGSQVSWPALSKVQSDQLLRSRRPVEPQDCAMKELEVRIIFFNPPVEQRRIMISLVVFTRFCTPYTSHNTDHTFTLTVRSTFRCFLIQFGSQVS